MIRVLVFPSCNEPGLEIIRSLVKSNKVLVHGGSSYDQRFDPSRLILQNHTRIPALNDHNFQDYLQNCIHQNGVNVVFPTTDNLVCEFSKWQLPGVSFVTPGPEAAAICSSKSRTYSILNGTVSTPKIYEGNNVPYPAYAKPDASAGGRGHRLVRNNLDLEVCRAEQLLVMEYLPGDEYTVDCFNDNNGNVMFVGPRLRGVVGRGIALGIQSIAFQEIEQLVHRIARKIAITGPWFVQFKQDSQKKLVLLEINARLGGSTTATRLAGVNLPLLAVFQSCGYAVRIPDWKPGVLVNRCLQNLVEGFDFKCVVWDLDDTLIRKDGKPDPDAISALYDCHNRGIIQILLTKSSDVNRKMLSTFIPSMFVDVISTDDKIAALPALMARHKIFLHDCVFVNDSNTERLSFEAAFPGIRMIGPESLESLGRELL